MSKIPIGTIEDLQNKLNLCVVNNSVRTFYDAADIFEQIRNNFHQLDSNNENDKLIDTALILRSILLPFTVKIIDFKSDIISQKMISFILWWIKKKPDKASPKQIIEVLAERRMYKLDNLKVKDCAKNLHKLVLEAPIKQATNAVFAKMDYIFSLFEIKTFGQDCDDLFELIMWLMKQQVEMITKEKSKEVLKVEPVFNANISEIWALFFDPLCIEKIDKIDLNDANDIIGELDLSKLSTEIRMPLTIHWSDHRSDVIPSRSYRRKRIDDLVYHLMDMSDERKCSELLNSLPHEKILNLIEKCANEKIKLRRQIFLSKQFIFLIEKLINTELSTSSRPNKPLFNQILNILTSYYKSSLNTSDFVVTIVNVLIKFPHFFQSENTFLENFIKFLTDDHLMKTFNSLFESLNETEKEIQDLINLIQIANLSFDELSKRTFQPQINFSFNWLKPNFDEITKEIEDQEIFHKLIKHLFCVMSLVTFISLIDLYLKTDNIFYVIYLATSVTPPTLKIVRDKFEKENFLDLYQAITKLVNAIYSNEQSYDNSSLAVETLINFLVSCDSKIKENPTLAKHFYQKEFIELLIRAVKKLKKVKKQKANTSILNFILYSMSNESYFTDKNEVDGIVQEIANDLKTFCVLLNHENLLLLLSLLGRKNEHVEKFLDNIISFIDLNEEDANKCLTSLLQCLGYLSDDVNQLIVYKLRSNIGIFIELLANKDFKKTSIKFLRKLLHFNDEENRMLDSYYGLNDLNKAKSEEKVETKEDQFLFFTTENIEKMRTKSKNDLDEVSPANISESIKTLNSNLKTLAEENQLKLKPFNNTEKFEKIKNSLNFVWTTTTKSNLNKILQAEVSPILLEGGTGIGKSATIQVAAEITKNNPIRFNMSSRVTIDDLLGKVTLMKDLKTNKDIFEFQLSPFAAAFEKGDWLLLDEMNLAPDNVLQCIENALDSKTLTLHNPCDSAKSVEVIKMNPNFRLFATQNPNVGFFKGKRERLSQSLLDRFTIYYFDELPMNEWVEIAENKLSKDKDFSPEEATELSETIVKKIHMNIKSKINDKEFQEKAAYAEITIRDMFKLCERLIFLKKSNFYDKQNSNKLLSFCTFLTYALRFRDNGRLGIIDVMKKIGYPAPTLEVEKYEISSYKVVFDDFVLKNYKSSNQVLVENISKNDPRFLYFSRILSLHDRVKKECFCKEFISEHGLYFVDQNWIFEWFDRLKFEKRENWNKIGFNIYASKFRHQIVREIVCDFFKTEFNNDVFDLTEIGKNTSLTSLRPFVLTERVLQIWKQIGWNLDSSYPILLSGNEGCGKSETIYALAKLIGMDITQVCLTPETEASHLVGQYNPNDGSTGGEKIIWQDGFITKAFKKGSSLLLDNFNQSDSCVLERLNPLLETQPIWVLTENRETTPLEKKENFKIFATMTVAGSSGNKTFYPELSPALYNRFSIIHMENKSWNEEKCFKSEISLIIKCLLDTKQSNQNYIDVISQVLWIIHSEVNLNDKKIEYGVITLRNYIRFIDMFYIISTKNAQKNINPELILFKCYRICFESQFKFRMNDNDVPKKSQLYEKIRKQLAITRENDFNLKNNYKFDDKYVLTESRTEFLETVLACIECNIPVLLEGK